MEKYVEEKLKEHDETLKTHGEDIETLKVSTAVHNTQIEAVCKKLDNLTTSIWALLIVLVGGLTTFFFTR